MRRFAIVRVVALVAMISASTFATSSAEPPGHTYVCPPCGNICDTLVHAQPGQCEGCGMALVSATGEKIKVAIVVWDGAELLDFTGPGEVLEASGYSNFETGESIESFIVAPTMDPITSQHFVTIVPEYSIETCPQPDVIVLPGGGAVTSNPKLMSWVKTAAPQARYVMSVCTGAFILAELGFLDGMTATTHHGSVDVLRTRFPKINVLGDVRWVDNGRYVTTAGVSAGIDGALHIVSKLFGQEVAERTAHYMQYENWDPKAGLITEDAKRSSGG